MKNRIWIATLGLIFGLNSGLVTLNAETCSENDMSVTNGLIKGYATAYDIHGTTASGEKTRDGICASSKERLGSVVIIYQRLPNDGIGRVIGIYECKDTGGTKGLNNGTVIDVWKPTYAECQSFMNEVYEDGCKGKIWIQVINGEG